MNPTDRFYTLVVLLALVLATTIAAPVKSGDSSKIKESKKTEDNAESTAKELEELSKSGNVVLPAAPVVAKVTEDKESERNDKEESTDQEEVSNLASDISESEDKAESKRQIPDAELFPANRRPFPIPSSGFDDVSLYPRESDIDLSPRAMAGYLLVTADFNGFDQALDDLLNTGMLSPAEILHYKDSVGREYEDLLQQVAQAESEYLQELSRVSPMDYFNTIQQPVRFYPEYPYNQNSLEYSDIDMDNYRDQMPSLFNYGDQVIPNYQDQVQDYQDKVQQATLEKTLLDKERTLDDVLSEMLNEYYGDQRQAQPEVEYDIEAPEDISRYESTEVDSNADDSETEDNENDDDDDDMKQFMAYLQQTLTSEQAGAGIIEIPDKDDEVKPDKVEQIDSTDVAKELDDLSPKAEDESPEPEEQSGEAESENAESKSL